MSLVHSTLAQFISMPGGSEWLIIAVIGLLLFGKRLPEVGRSLGRGIVEFKKGLRGIEDQIEDAVSRPSTDETQSPTESSYTPPASEYHSPDVAAETQQAHENQPETDTKPTEPTSETTKVYAGP